MTEVNETMTFASEEGETTAEAGERLVEFRRGETEYILEEMFKRVGEVYTPEFVRQPEWYLLHSWTIKESAEFTKWLEGYLKRRHRGVGVKRAAREASWFVLNVGWAFSPLESVSADGKFSTEEAPIAD